MAAPKTATKKPKAKVTKPPVVLEVEKFVATSVEEAWRRLGSRPKPSDADFAMIVDTMRADRARYVLKRRAKGEDS